MGPSVEPMRTSQLISPACRCRVLNAIGVLTRQYLTAPPRAPHRSHDPVAGPLEVFEDAFGLGSPDVLSVLRLWADPAMHQAHADWEENIVALVFERHATMFTLCSVGVKPRLKAAPPMPAPKSLQNFSVI